MPTEKPVPDFKNGLFAGFVLGLLVAAILAPIAKRFGDLLYALFG